MKELATPTVRYLEPADRDLLATDHQMIGLELPDHGLVAVTAHEEDLVVDSRHPLVRAVVACENTRSLALCSRVGLLSERADEDPQHVQRWGVIALWGPTL